MIGKNYNFDGNTIPYTGAAAKTAKWLADFKIHTVATETPELPRQDWHGAITSPTYARGRLIPVNGEFFAADKTQRTTPRQEIEDIFKLPGFPDKTNEIKRLDFEDDDGTEWFIRCKVYQLPQFEHERGSPVGTFFLQLYAEDPFIRSKNPKTGTENYSLFGGVRLPEELPFAMNQYSNVLTVNNAGNYPSATKITITGDILNPKVLNLTTGRYFALNTDITAGETLIIDSGQINTDPFATINGVNALADRVSGSQWLFVNPGENKFVLLGDDYELGNDQKAEMTVEFYDVRL